MNKSSLKNYFGGVDETETLFNKFIHKDIDEDIDPLDAFM